MANFGLNVAILFTILLFLFTVARVPFAARYLTIPALLLIYAVATGGSPSALRAWFMLTIWSVGRGLRLPTPPVNTVLLAALVLLTLDPLTLFQIGFQFSFLVVLAILLGWRAAQRLLAWWRAPEQWVPFRARPWSWRAASSRLAVSTTLAMLIFWLGGVGLTAWYNQLFLPAAVLTNTLAGAIAWLVMVLGTVKLLVGLLALALPLGLVDWLIGRGLVAAMWLLQESAALGSTRGGVQVIPQPHLALVVIYYAGLLALLLTPLRLRAIAGRGLLVAGLTAVLVAGPRCRQPARRADLLIPAGSNIPVLVVQAAGRPPIVVNAGPKGFAYALGAWLRGEGVARLDQLILLDARAAGSGGALDLVAAYRPELVAVAGPARRLEASVGEGQRTAGRGWLAATDGRLELPQASVRAGAGGVRDEYTGWLAPGRGAPLAFVLRVDPAGESVWRVQLAPDQPWREYRFGFADRDRWLRLE